MSELAEKLLDRAPGNGRRRCILSFAQMRRDKHSSQLWRMIDGRQTTAAVNMNASRALRTRCFELSVVMILAVSCKSPISDAHAGAADSLGALPTGVRSIPVAGRRDLVESSSATITPRQPGIIFTINDSDNEAVLFALDSTGSMRGAWRIANATDEDWESTAHGACHTTNSDTAAPSSCIFIGDAGDNRAHRSAVVIYQVPEPTVSNDSSEKTLDSQKLVLRYPDGPH
ncbi:MAG: hypothetical protein M3Y64_04880, partial [Gemmatimonadota bacterium]|nr:hypothetical protein [Gemmatimonadota bacterium]